MYPNKRNFCGGNFQDWLEVMLIEKCNGKCSWCIEENGYKPSFHADWKVIVDRVLDSGKQNIILLGGEPTLYRYLEFLVRDLVAVSRNVYITTNGSLLSPEFVKDKLRGIAGVNISIHDPHLDANEQITGIRLEVENLKETISALQTSRAVVRLNCNLIKGHIDSEASILSYIEVAKSLGANSVRFAELKGDEDNFVNLYSIYGSKYGINNEPFGLGCNSDVVINEMPVNFRQMCGLQTPLREAPINPESQVVKKVLYYDGNLYNGWQTKEGRNMTEKRIVELLLKVSDGEVSIVEATKIFSDALAVSAKPENASLPFSLPGEDPERVRIRKEVRRYGTSCSGPIRELLATLDRPGEISSDAVTKVPVSATGKGAGCQY